MSRVRARTGWETVAWEHPTPMNRSSGWGRFLGIHALVAAIGFGILALPTNGDWLADSLVLRELGCVSDLAKEGRARCQKKARPNLPAVV